MEERGKYSKFVKDKLHPWMANIRSLDISLSNNFNNYFNAAQFNNLMEEGENLLKQIKIWNTYPSLIKLQGNKDFKSDSPPH